MKEQTPRDKLALELAALVEPQVKDMCGFLEALADDPGNENLADMLTARLLDRTIYLLRRGSRRELVDESFELADFLESEAGERLGKACPDLGAAWGSLEDLISAAADRNDPDAVDSILLSHRGRGQKVLELLAERQGPVRRVEIRRALGEEVSDSLVSHLLRDLEDADLIVRFRAKGSKEVQVELGPVGRDLEPAPKERSLEQPGSSDLAKAERDHLAELYRTQVVAFYPHLHGRLSDQGEHAACHSYGPN